MSQPCSRSRSSPVIRCLVALLGAAALAVSGCSDPELSGTASADLQQQAGAVRAAAAAGDVAGAEAALAQMRATLEGHTAQGAITEDRVLEITAAIELVSDRLHLLVPEDPSPPPEAPADPQPHPESPADPAPEPGPAPGSRGDGDGNDEDQGNGEDGDDGDGDGEGNGEDGKDGDEDGDDERDGRGPDGRGPPGQRDSD